jgi:protein phosphatase|eukprot:TRINITY_DN629_c0_g1_i2.p1 TRINITY_DN629_c0_g1~~TRINITY_DN629_c0_g1_i2.p1  ORF type:complete len:351 (+),score=85.50 TRINITY_DN629_c0_g1_i2:59-1111(+)
MGNAMIGHAETAKTVVKEGNQHYRAAVAAMTGYRESMEDAHCMHCRDQFGLFGVFDGHGGAHCSHFCATKLPLEIAKRELPISDDDVTRITLQIDDEYRRNGGSAGSTACYCIVTATENEEFLVQVVNVGDSRLIVGRNGGAECVPMTQDHKPTVKGERQRIERAGGFVEADRVDGILAVSRAIGDFEYKSGPGGPLVQKVIARPDVTHVTCTSNDWLLIACDGVFEGHFSNEDVVRHVRNLMKVHSDDISQVACGVCDEALKRGSTDNVTCMIVQFTEGTAYRRVGSTVVSGPPARTLSRPFSSVASRAGSTVESLKDKLRRHPSSTNDHPDPHRPAVSPITRAPTSPR